MIPKELFYPESVAVIGASRNPGKVGYGVFTNLILTGFPGRIYGVNPEGGSILGKSLYRDISEIEGSVDLGVFVIPPKHIISAVPLLAKKGMKAAVIISAGFKEVGEVGATLERELRTELEKAGIRAVGPNCLGIINTHGKLNVSFSAGTPIPGPIAFFSQSGAMCTAILDWGIGVGMGFSKVVSFGNAVDVTELELLEYLAEDPETRVIMGYVESIQNGQEFLRVAKRVTAKKPVILLKAGATTAGARAAASHTGSLAGSDFAYSAAFRQGGILRAETTEELVDFALAFAMQPVPEADTLLIVTNAGGPAIMATDAAEKAGVPLAEVPEGLREKFRGVLPSTASVANPVDVIGDAKADRYFNVFQAIREDSTAGAVLVLLTPQAMTEPEKTAQTTIECLGATGKTVLASFLGEKSVGEARTALRGGMIPEYPKPERAVRALRAMQEYRRILETPPETIEKREPPPAAAELIHRAVTAGYKRLGERTARKILREYGIAFPEYLVAKTEEEAVEAYKYITAGKDSAVAMKVASEAVVHKTDIGGVRLNLRSEAEVVQAFREISANLKRFAPMACASGISIQEMVTEGKEVILGMSRDPQFGPLIMFGLGGIYVEILRDISFRVAPIGYSEAKEMVREIRGYKLFSGFRGGKALDEEAVIAGLLAISRFAHDFPEVKELDINPAIVKEAGMWAADCRISLF